MSIIQQIHSIVEKMPETDQAKVLKLVKKINNDNTSAETKKALKEKALLERQKKAIKGFIEAINAIDEPLGEEYDQILSQRVNITRELDL